MLICRLCVIALSCVIFLIFWILVLNCLNKTRCPWYCGEVFGYVHHVCALVGVPHDCWGDDSDHGFDQLLCLMSSPHIAEGAWERDLTFFPTDRTSTGGSLFGFVSGGLLPYLPLWGRVHLSRGFVNIRGMWYLD